MRYIGIDYGTKKVGIALSDEGGAMAFPHSVIKNDKTFRERVLTLVRENSAAVVLGDSRTYDGSENPIAEGIKELASFLGQAGIAVSFESELYTSRAAERIQGKTDMIDASAAALMLDSYLQRNQPKS